MFYSHESKRLATVCDIDARVLTILCSSHQPGVWRRDSLVRSQHSFFLRESVLTNFCVQVGLDDWPPVDHPKDIAKGNSGCRRTKGMRNHPPARGAHRVAPPGQSSLWTLESLFATVSLCPHGRREGPGPYEGLLQRLGWNRQCPRSSGRKVQVRFAASSCWK
jgi:hypothetical protein